MPLNARGFLLSCVAVSAGFAFGAEWAFGGFVAVWLYSELF